MEVEVSYCTIEMTEEAAMAYKAFIAHYSDFKAIIDSGMLNVKGGRAIINFDPQGNMRDIEIQQKAWLRGK